MPTGGDDRQLVDLLAQGDERQALARAEALLGDDPSDLQLRELRAALLLSLGQVSEARQTLRQLVTESEVSSDSLKRLALCEALEGDYAAAAETNRRLLEIRPGDFIARLNYADCLSSIGDDVGALPNYFRAIRDAQLKGRWLGDDTTAPNLRGRVKAAMDTVDAGRHALFEAAIAPSIELYGRDAMSRVIAGLEQYLGIEQHPLSDARQRPTFFHVPDLKPTPYFDRALFAWYEALESSTDLIAEELAQVLLNRTGVQPFLNLEGVANAEAYLAGPAASRSWDASFFYRHGERYAGTHEQCPKTSEALSKVPLTEISDHAPEVLFSILSPGTHITPHYGVTNTRVVTHLPLLIPPGDCQLVVGGIAHAWHRGRCVTFDDTFVHEAWNRTSAQRVVLILDTWNPYLMPEECVAVRSLVEAIGGFNLKAGIR